MPTPPQSLLFSNPDAFWWRRRRLVLDEIMDAWKRRDGAFWDRLVGLCDGERRTMIVEDALGDIVFSSSLVANFKHVKDLLDLCDRHHLKIPPMLLERAAGIGAKSLALVLPRVKGLEKTHMYPVYLIAERQNSAALEQISSVLDLSIVFDQIQRYAVENSRDLKAQPIVFLEEFVATQQREKLLGEIDQTHCAREKYNRKI